MSRSQNIERNHYTLIYRRVLKFINNYRFAWQHFCLPHGSRSSIVHLGGQHSRWVRLPPKSPTYAQFCLVVAQLGIKFWHKLPLLHVYAAKMELKNKEKKKKEVTFYLMQMMMWINTMEMNKFFPRNNISNKFLITCWLIPLFVKSTWWMVFFLVPQNENHANSR